MQGYKPDYMYLLQRTMMDSPDAAVNLAKMIAKQPGPPIELNVIADLFLQRNMVREATAFLLEVLQDNNPEHEKLQTKVKILRDPPPPPPGTLHRLLSRPITCWAIMGQLCACLQKAEIAIQIICHRF